MCKTLPGNHSGEAAGIFPPFIIERGMSIILPVPVIIRDYDLEDVLQKTGHRVESLSLEILLGPVLWRSQRRPYVPPSDTLLVERRAEAC